jgi:PKD repeat protein
VDEGSAVTVTVTASDPAGANDPLTYEFDFDNDGAFEVSGSDEWAQHAYVDNGSYTVGVRVTDGDGGETLSSTVVTVENVAPTATFGNDSPQTEASPVNVSFADVTDPGTADTLTYSFDWDNDGVYEIVDQISPAAAYTWYDDGTYTVRGRVADNHGGFTEYSTDVVVANVAPTVTSVTNNGPVDEGSAVTVTVTASDPAGSNDPLTYEFDFDNDGGYEVSGSDNWAQHTYADNGSYTVGVRVTDGDGGEAFSSTVVTVENVAPTVTGLAATPVHENETTTLSCTISDSGTVDTFTVEIDWDHDGIVDETHSSVSAGLFRCSHPCLDDDPSGTSVDDMSIHLTVTDNDGGSVGTLADVEVANVAPVITDVWSSSPACGEAAERELVSVNATFTDSGTLDTHAAMVQWGDGAVSIATVTEDGGSGSIYAEHPAGGYADGGVYQITVTVTDDDLGEDSATTMSIITGAGVQDGTLYVMGTADNDRVIITRYSRGRVRVIANFLERPGYKLFQADEIDNIYIELCDGHDYAHIANNIYQPATMLGGAGNDRLRGARGDDVLLGGAGNDRLWGMQGDNILVGGDGQDNLYGYGGRDMLIGGQGNDYLSGSSGDDIAIGGWTRHDNDLDALDAIFREWLSDDNYMSRVGALYDDLLDPDSSVSDDSVADVLVGGGGRDWFFADLVKDRLPGRGRDELVEEL